MDLNYMRKIAGLNFVTEKKKNPFADKKDPPFKKGKNFEKIEAKAGKKFGSKKVGKKVAKDAFKKKFAKEDVEYTESEIDKIILLWESEDDDDDDLSPAEKELAAMGTKLDKKTEDKLKKADKKDEEKSAKKTKAEKDDEDDEKPSSKKDEAEEDEEQGDAARTRKRILGIAAATKAGAKNPSEDEGKVKSKKVSVEDEEEGMPPDVGADENEEVKQCKVCHKAPCVCEDKKTTKEGVTQMTAKYELSEEMRRIAGIANPLEEVADDADIILIYEGEKVACCFPKNQKEQAKAYLAKAKSAAGKKGIDMHATGMKFHNAKVGMISF